MEIRPASSTSSIREPLSGFNLLKQKETTTEQSPEVRPVEMTETTQDKQKEGGYKMGYSQATTASHASRTIHTDAAFVIPHVRPHHKVLDVGCGPGTITAGFADLVSPSAGGRVVGVDAGAAVISSASALAASRGLDRDHRLSFQVGDVLAGLPFADGEFDVVFTSQTLSHLGPGGAPAALREMRRVLRPEGGLLAARDAAGFRWEPCGEELEGFMGRMFEALGVPGPAGARMPGYLRAAGWDVDDPEKTVFGGGATVVAGREKRLWWRDTVGGRLARGDPFRERWLEIGLSEEQVDAYKNCIDRWAEDENGWYGALQSEVLAWK